MVSKSSLLLKINTNSIKLTQSINVLEKFKQSIQTYVDEIIFTMTNQLNANYESIQQFIERFDSNQELLEKELEQIDENITQSVEKQQLDRNQQLNYLRKKINNDQIFKGLDIDPEAQNDLKEQIVSQEVSAIIEQESNQKQDLENITGIKPKNICWSFEFNKDSSCLFIGTSDGEIKVCEFKNGKLLRLIQSLKVHKKPILCLQSFKKTNQLISGGYDGSIMIFKQNEKMELELQQKLTGHDSAINSLVINGNEDIIISGSDDKSIQIWQKQDSNEWINKQTISTQFLIYSLSINESEQQIIASGSSNEILVIQYQVSKQNWSIIQKIKVLKGGYRLQFINEKNFIFLPESDDILEIFELNKITKEYSKIRQIEIKKCQDNFGFFPSQFIASQNILVIKNGIFVCVFNLNEGGEISLQKSLEYSNDFLFGRLDSQGTYLVTWDQQDKLQVRNIKE